MLRNLENQNLTSFSKDVHLKNLLYKKIFFKNFNYLTCIKSVIKAIIYFHDIGFSFNGIINKKFIFFKVFSK